MLQALIRDDRLTEKERGAFDGMLRSIASGTKLSSIQRDWFRDSYRKYELDANTSENLVSSGAVPRGKETKFPFESMTRPLKPPGRK